MIPEPKFAVIADTDHHNRMYVVCLHHEAFLIMRFVCSLYGFVETSDHHPIWGKFPFSFTLWVSPLFSFLEVYKYIQDGLDLIQEHIDD